MAVCPYCSQEMLVAESCDPRPIMIGGRPYEPVRYGTERGWGRPRRRCHDCNVRPGAVHHHGCDMERCPECGDQSFMCGCVWDGEENHEDDEDYEDESLARMAEIAELEALFGRS